MWLQAAFIMQWVHEQGSVHCFYREGLLHTRKFISFKWVGNKAHQIETEHTSTNTNNVLIENIFCWKNVRELLQLI